MRDPKEQADWSDMTFSELFDAWLNFKKQTISPTAVKHYADEYRRFLLEPFGSRKVNDISSAEWQEFETALPSLKGKSGKEIAPTTARELKLIARRAFEYGKDNFGLNDPAAEITEQDDAPSFFTSDEVERMKAAVKPYNIIHLCIMLCIYAGVTQGEISGLQWGDVDTDKGTITIQRSKVRNKFGDKTVLKLSKKPQDAIRTVPIPDWINEQLKLIKKLYKDSDIILISKRGELEPSNFINHHYTEFLQKANVPFRTFTALRNTYLRSHTEEGTDAESAPITDKANISRDKSLDDNTKSTRKKRSKSKSRITVSELFEIWLTGKKDSISPSTVTLYQFLFSRYVAEPFGDRAVNSITYDEWISFEKELLDGKDTNCKDVAATTATTAVNYYRSVFRYGKTEFGLNDPTEDLLVTPKNDDSVTVFSPAETARMIAAVKPYEIFHICIMLCLYTGATVSEICGVQWGDIDTKKKLLKIRRVIVSISDPERKKLFIYKETIPENPKVIRDLHIPDWINEQLETIKSMHSDDEYLLADNMRESTPPNFRSHYTLFLKEAGVKPKNVKALRDTFAVACISKRMNIKTLTELLGLSSSIITMRTYCSKGSKNVSGIIETLYD